MSPSMEAAAQSDTLSSVVLSLVLLALALALALAEVLVVSFGVLGLAAVAALGFAIWYAFQADPVFGQGVGGNGQLSKVIPETVHQAYAPCIAVHLPEEIAR